jgi:hypothetical protein
MLVIVQNPGMSDFALSDDFNKEPKKPEGAFNMSHSFQQQRCPDSASALLDHEGLQLRLRSSGDLSASAESGSRRDSRLPGSCERDVKEGSRCVDGKEDRNATVFVNDVVVDMKRLKGYSFLQLIIHVVIHGRCTLETIQVLNDSSRLQVIPFFFFLQRATFSKLCFLQEQFWTCKLRASIFLLTRRISNCIYVG